MSRYLNKTLNIMITENGCYANVRPRIGLKRERKQITLIWASFPQKLLCHDLMIGTPIFGHVYVPCLASENQPTRYLLSKLVER